MILAFFVVVFFSLLAFWRYNALLFMLAAGGSVMTGFYWRDTYTTNLGLAIGILLVVYGIVCLGFALPCIFWRKQASE